ncbi:MAG: histone deacetylase [Euryarchaeota archaeon]|nr:histone deacetylase [Euryarchaeota archaeon]|tara:strand:+ start:4857 stop:5819 length:963 start_codon:yes stop_codon:yes gene_type:complete
MDGIKEVKNSPLLNALPIWYHSIYTDGIHPDARFPRDRYTKLVEKLLYSKFAPNIDIRTPEKISRQNLLLAHDENYVDKFLNGELDEKQIKRIGLTPWTPEIIPRTLTLMGGAVSALEYVIENGGIAANLAGGTHHAHREFGSGYCIFNDLAVCAIMALENINFNRIAILDLDVHQGDGTATIFEDLESVLTISVHCSKNFPFRKTHSDFDLELEPGTEDEEYLEVVKKAIQITTNFNPDLILFQAGVDGLKSDALGKLNITREGMRKRNNLVFEMIKKESLPTVIFMGGGYSKPISDTIDAFYDLFTDASLANLELMKK